MKRRDSDRHHDYAHEVFDRLKVYDLQGLLQEGDEYKCGVEAYQVKDFGNIDFGLLRQDEELARLRFCQLLAVPYYLIISAESCGGYEIYRAELHGSLVSFERCHCFSKAEFLHWWRQQQSFTQKKIMYNAASRLSQSIIDADLFGNSLAWGVNIDGFVLNDAADGLVAIIEKRVCTYNPPYTVHHYDPNKYFFGTANRAGDYPAWHILFLLAQKLKTQLLLLSFDTSSNRCVGAAKIIDISKEKGIAYKHNEKPFERLYNDNLEQLSAWIRNDE